MSSIRPRSILDKTTLWALDSQDRWGRALNEASGRLLESDLGSVFARRRSALISSARRIGGQDAEDVVQDAALRLVSVSHREEIGEPNRLLSRLTLRAAIDRIRWRVSRAGISVCAPGAEAIDPTGDPERALMGVQRLRAVRAEIDAMPPRRREVFLLHRIDELTYPQIAKRLGISVKAVEKHMSLAIKQLAALSD